MSAIDWVRKLYGGKIMGYSVAATEHSIMCSYGQENELASFERLVDVAEPGSILSVVSDTWNIYDAARKWVSLKDKIVEKNITLVVRPDSGDIEVVLPQVLAILEKGFGFTRNNKGYKVLNNVKVLWGDGINEDTVAVPFQIALDMHISADSIMTGSGGGLMQVDINRDTNKFAFKASNIRVNGKDLAIAKDPITDPGKKSKKGRLVLRQDGHNWFTLESNHDANDCLETVYLDGKLVKDESFEEIKKRIRV